MTATKTTDRDYNVQVLTDTVRGRFASKNALMGSVLASQGAIIVNDTLDQADPAWIGNEVTVPYFGVVGEFTDNPEDQAVAPVPLRGASEKASLGRSSLAIEVSRWARYSGQDDPYEEGAQQIEEAAVREMDRLCIAAAAGTPLVKDVYSPTNPAFLNWDLVVDGRALWGDEQSDIVAMVIHSRAEADLRKLKDAQGRPLLLDSQRDGELTRFCGVPLVVSDRMPLTGSSMGAVGSAGTTPPTLAVSGTPAGPWQLRLRALSAGALGAWTFQFSTDGGNLWSAPLASGASLQLMDPAPDSLVGNNGKTGLILQIGAGNANPDNVWGANANLKATTLIVQRGACAFWYNRRAMSLETDKDILKHNDVAAMHMYRVAHRYRRRRGGYRPGVVAIKHNLQGFVN